MKDVDDMSESELKKELKKLYQEVNDVSDAAMDEITFKAKMKLKKKNDDDEVVETRETAI